ncbi:DUF4097 domain-containing protein [bacterium]|nr:DUF4097 domain-containing protein [bacterium]
MSISVYGKISFALLVILLLQTSIFAQIEPEINWEQNKRLWIATIEYDVPLETIHLLSVLNFPGHVTIRGDASIQKVTATFKSTRKTQLTALEELKNYIPIVNQQDSMLRVEGPKNLPILTFSEIMFSLEIILPMESNVELTGRNGKINISNIGGDLKTLVEFGELSVSEVYGNLFIQTSNSPVKLDKIYGNLAIDLLLGDLTATEIRSNIKMRCTMGNISLTNLQGDLNCSLEGGELRIKDVTSSNTNIHATIGGIILRNVNCHSTTKIVSGAGDISLRDCKTDLNINSKSGELTLRGHRGNVEITKLTGKTEIQDHTGNVSVSSQSGDIFTELETSKEQPTNVVYLFTKSGDVTLEVPETIPFNLRGELRGKLAGLEVISDFPVEYSRENGILVGSIVNGSGSVPITMISGMGNLFIRKN